MKTPAFGTGSPKSFHAYPRGGDFVLEVGDAKKSRKPRSFSSDLLQMVKFPLNRLHHFYSRRPILVSFLFLSIGVSILVFLSVYEHGFRVVVSSQLNVDHGGASAYPFAGLRDLVMVAGHSIYTSSSCGKAVREDSWFLESKQKHPGQAITFLAHVKEGADTAGKDGSALLLFSGGEMRKDAGPRSEAQSYWAVAESKDWFGECFRFVFFFKMSSGNA